MELPAGTARVDAVPYCNQEEIEAAVTLEDVQDAPFDRDQADELVKRILARYPWLTDLLDTEQKRVDRDNPGTEVIPALAIGFCAGAALRMAGKYMERGGK